jgi:hypothetical protein
LKEVQAITYNCPQDPVWRNVQVDREGNTMGPSSMQEKGPIGLVSMIMAHTDGELTLDIRSDPIL